ncbi:hypothetical protein FX985_06445 [Pseudomonas extremaustralis]|uniref:Uncharacterized protein n=1 Tax=Pseudomonas extremaustralis TaxID=359110 RepID=A0A5M9IKE7_9PSED|nr:hypothetical protein FX985_06445 [Pseudomonas extremaustralis]
MRRHHVVRQLLTQGGLERFGILLLGDQVGDQLMVGRQHQRFTHAGLGQQQRLDFPQLNAETTDFHLMVDTPDVLDHPVGTVARQVAGAVQALAGCAERVRHKAFGAQQRTVQIGAGQTAVAADIQLAHRAQWCQVQVAIQHVQGTAWQGATNRAGGGTDGLAGRAIQHTRDHRGLGRAVGIQQSNMAQAGLQPLRRAVQRHGFTADMDLAQRAIRARPRRQAVEQKQVPVGGGQVGQGDALSDDFLVQPRAVPQLWTAQHHSGAVAQRRIELLDEPVEVQGGELQDAIVLGQPRIARRDAGELGQRPMVDRHALGFAGGAGGVDHVGEVLRVDGYPRIRLGVRGQIRMHQVQRRQAFGQRQVESRLGQHQAHAAVFKHMQQAFTRVLRVERHIGAAGLEHRQQAHHHLERALHRHADQPFGADTPRDQRMGQAVGLAVQFGITQRLSAQAQRRVLRTPLRLVLEQMLHPLLNRARRGRGIPIPQQARVFLAIKQPQLADGLPGISRHSVQQVLPMPRQACHGGGLEQVGGVGQRGPYAFGGLLGIQAQIEMRGVAVPLQPFHPQAGQLLATRHTRLGLVVEHHLEQWVVAQAALRLQGFHQLLERQVLVRLGLQGAMLDLLQQLGKGHLPVDIGLEHLGVDEEADQAFGLHPVAVGDRHPDTDVRLPAVAMQHGLERRQQQHEQRDPFALRQALEAGNHIGIQADFQLRATVALHRGARVVQRQLQYRLLAAQQALPVLHLALLLAGVHPLALPPGVIGVLQHQRG